MTQSRGCRPYPHWTQLLVVLGGLIWLSMPCVGGFYWGVDELEDWFVNGAMPVGALWNVSLLAGGMWIWRKRHQPAALALGLALVVWLFGNPTIANHLFAWHESRAHGTDEDPFAESFEAIAVLGGCSRRLPNDRVEVNAFGERIVTAARVWHAQRTELVVVTGGTSIDDPDAECVKNEALLIMLGVPRDKIIRLPARNTQDEIKALTSFVRERPLPNAGAANSQDRLTLGLVTNAFHIPRAMRLANQQGLEATALPAGHYAYIQPWKPSKLIPTAESVMLNSLLLKEALAWTVGR